MPRQESVLWIIAVAASLILAMVTVFTAPPPWLWMGLALGFGVAALAFRSILRSPHLTALVRVQILSVQHAADSSPWQ